MRLLTLNTPPTILIALCLTGTGRHFTLSGLPVEHEALDSQHTTDDSYSSLSYWNWKTLHSVRATGRALDFGLISLLLIRKSLYLTERHFTLSGDTGRAWDSWLSTHHRRFLKLSVLLELEDTSLCKGYRFCMRLLTLKHTTDDSYSSLSYWNWKTLHSVRATDFAWGSWLFTLHIRLLLHE